MCLNIFVFAFMGLSEDAWAFSCVPCAWGACGYACLGTRGQPRAAQCGVPCQCLHPQGRLNGVQKLSDSPSALLLLFGRMGTKFPSLQS